MTAEEFRSFLLLDEFKRDLTELSSYLASVKQEGPIVECLAKQLWKRKITFQVEAKHKDLFVDGTHIEFKFHYDADMERLKDEKGELKKYGDNLKGHYEGVQAKLIKKHGWTLMPEMYKDVCVKKPDLFVWIICARDLSKLSPDQLSRICVWYWQAKYNQSYPYSDREYLAQADLLISILQAYRPFSVVKEEIVTNGDFPSTYHFWLFDFSKTT